MPATLVDTIEDGRPPGMPWSAMPTWFHLASFAYFITNVFLAWGTVMVNVPLLPTALTLFGLTGGFIEHLSPYFPRLYINPKLERFLFRVPTVVGLVWIGVCLNLAWFVLLLFLVQSVGFLREKPLTSMEPQFHLHHVFVTHFLGCVQMFVLVLIASGQYRALDFLVASS